MVTVQGSFMQFWDGGESARGIMVIVIVVVMVMAVTVQLKLWATPIFPIDQPSASSI